MAGGALAADIPTADPAAVRDLALQRARLTDMRPLIAPNWGNGSFDPLTSYLAGDLSPAAYAAFPVKSGYRFDDRWGFGTLGSGAPDYLAGGSCYLSHPFIGPLAARYVRTGAPRYLAGFLRVAAEIAAHERPALAGVPRTTLNAVAGCSRDLDGGNAEALLIYGWFVGNTMNAFAAMAKGTDAAPQPWSAAVQQPVDAPLTAAGRDRFDADALYALAAGFARNVAPDLLDRYGRVGRVQNQRISGLTGLAHLAWFFGRQPDVNAIQGRIATALADAIDDITYKDGALSEQSFNYAAHTADELARVAKIPIDAPYVAKAAAAASGFAMMEAALATPQGGLPQVGNSVWSDGDLLGSVRFGTRSITFPYAGYTALRSSWDRDAAYLFFFNRRHANGHTMAGSNSIQFGAYGRRLVVAGGIPNYGGVNPDYPASVPYLAEGSSWKTSTVLVDGKSQARGSEAGLSKDASGKPDRYRAAPVPIAARFHTGSAFDFVEGLHDGGYAAPGDKTVLADTTHWRGVVFVRDLMTTVVVDVMRSPGTHDYTGVWKLAPPRSGAGGVRVEGFTPEQVTIDPARRRVFTTDATPGAVNLALRQFGAAGTITGHWGGDKGAFGYYGHTFTADRLGFSEDIHSNARGTGDTVVITLLRPVRNAAGADGVTVRRDIVRNGVTTLDLTVDGQRLSLRVSPTVKPICAGTFCVPATMILTEGPTPASRALVIGDPTRAGGSFVIDGGTRSPVTAPTGFRWTVGPDGTVSPDYR